MYVGVANTLIHWAVFGVVYHFSGVQSTSNLIAFFVAVTFSFFANAKFTFKTQATRFRYIAYVAFLGLLSWIVGRVADASQLAPLLTLVVFSGISLVVGFVYSKLIVFRSEKP